MKSKDPHLTVRFSLELGQVQTKVNSYQRHVNHDGIMSLSTSEMQSTFHDYNYFFKMGCLYMILVCKNSNIKYTNSCRTLELAFDTASCLTFEVCCNF